ncbi:hypothetical protein [Moorena sp. SIO3H5]|uniref:hypothetical protein n=1 Tax=Moorena sp. SIO3H5 TaxID=2607834 RepID=UPI0013B9B0FB|nr:hypothetical protein [Moorena sp. SIO3H5]NEO72425.1 hypothetical protein [Moorena sp. SIO3H5]
MGLDGLVIDGLVIDGLVIDGLVSLTFNSGGLSVFLERLGEAVGKIKGGVLTDGREDGVIVGRGSPKNLGSGEVWAVAGLRPAITVWPVSSNSSQPVTLISVLGFLNWSDTLIIIGLALY